MNVIYTGIVYLSLDWGIAWNYKGYKFPTAKCWTWCTNDQKIIIDYISKLKSMGLLPVLYSYGVDIDFIKIIESFFTTVPIIEVGESLEIIHAKIIKKYNSSLTIGHKVYRIGPPSTIGIYQSLEDIKIDPSNTFNKVPPQLLILMGQTGSGKSRFCSRLQQEGWLVIDEHLADQIKRLAKTDSKVIRDFELSLTKHTHIVIDSDNPRLADRQVFIDLATKYNIKYVIGWITRPSYYYYFGNSLVPEEVLQNYALNLEDPGDNGFRLI